MFRLTGIALILLSAVCLTLCFRLDKSEYKLFDTLVVISSISLITGICVIVLITNFTGRWINDRLNEKIWVENGSLYHLFFFSESGGVLMWTPGERASQTRIELDKIRDARHDPRSGRIELGGPIYCTVFQNYSGGITNGEKLLPSSYKHVLYDYTSPSLYDYLVGAGVEFKKETIKYSLFDRRA